MARSYAVLLNGFLIRTVLGDDGDEREAFVAFPNIFDPIRLIPQEARVFRLLAAYARSVVHRDAVVESARIRNIPRPVDIRRLICDLRKKVRWCSIQSIWGEGKGAPVIGYILEPPE